MPTITECLERLKEALSAYFFRPFQNLTVEDIDNLLS